MANNNFYNLIENQLVKTIKSDPWLGTTGTNVMTIEARLRPGPRSYYDHELPAISFKLIGKRQDHFTMTEFDKFFRFIAFVLARGGDLDNVVDTIQEITSVLENTLEAQFTPDNDLYGLGTHADVLGGPVIEIVDTEFNYTEDAEQQYTVLATITGDINIITT